MPRRRGGCAASAYITRGSPQDERLAGEAVVRLAAAAHLRVDRLAAAGTGLLGLAVDAEVVTPLLVALVEAVGDLGTLELLRALTEADSRATGPSAWSAWKASLIDELVDRVIEAGACTILIGMAHRPCASQSAIKLDCQTRAIILHNG